MKYYLIILILNLIKSTFCANILIISLLPSPSHYIWNEAIAEGLVKNGHNVTLLGHDDPRFTSDNYTVLKIEGVYEHIENNIQLPAMSNMNELQIINVLWNLMASCCEIDIKSKPVETLRNYPEDTFDVILFDVIAGHCLYPLIEKFQNPPVIAISAFALPVYVGDMMGHHIFPYVPFYMLPYSDKMNFMQKLENLFLSNVDVFMRKYSYLPSLYVMAQEVFGQNITKFEEIERRITLALCNVDLLLDYPQPMTPNIILVGGLHVKPPKRLPQDLQILMDEATNGVIYFSLGTNIKPEHLPHEQRQYLMDVFGRLPYTVLAKFDGTKLKVPKNVILKKWFPQNDILAHKNLKVFLTHGGALSTHEALYHGVPLVGMPLFIDQKRNMVKIVSRNLGIMVDFSSKKKDLYEAIMEVAKNPIYRKNMQNLSKKFHDQPQTPLERAIFWIEYVIRNGDADHLSTAARDMYAFETLYLDVFLFIILVVVLLIYIIKSLIRFSLSLLTKKAVQKSKQQ